MEETRKWLEAISTFIGLILIPLFVGLVRWMFDLRSTQSEHTHALREFMEWRGAHEAEVRARMAVVQELREEFRAMTERLEWHAKALERQGMEMRDILKEMRDLARRPWSREGGGC